MKIQFASKVAMFQQRLAYKEASIMCYDCQIKALTKKIPLAQT
jgi:Sec7-like guanine-nucleotide exchange factor